MTVRAAKAAPVRLPASPPPASAPSEMVLNFEQIARSAEAVRAISVQLTEAMNTPEGDRHFVFRHGDLAVEVLLAPRMERRKIVQTDIYVQCPDGTQINVHTPYPAACVVFALLTQSNAQKGQRCPEPKPRARRRSTKRSGAATSR